MNHRFHLIALAVAVTAGHCSDDSAPADSGPADSALDDSTPDIETDSAVDMDPDVDDADVALDPDVTAEPDLVEDTALDVPVEPTFEAERLFPTESAAAPTFADCLFASPLAWERSEGEWEIIVGGGDVVVGLAPDTGELLWTVELPEPAGGRAYLAATPALRGDLLAVGYQTFDTDETTNTLDPATTGHRGADPRQHHYVAMIDLKNRSLAEGYETVELVGGVPTTAGDATVTFSPTTEFMRSQLVWVKDGESADAPEYVYVEFGNTRDIQPWHGWVFEIDVGAWHDGTGEDAISSLLCVTPEDDCGTSGVSGAGDRICGGGLWTPSGPLAVPTATGVELVLAPDNGQLDLERGDYANTLMRVAPGLSFDPGCDPTLCADFDPDSPSRDCVESCDRLFIPRPLAGEGPPRPESGLCDGLDWFECWEVLDFAGGSTPVFVPLDGGPDVLVYPMKDGALYLVDFDHLGTMYDREELLPYCGTTDLECWWPWAGTIITQPALTERDGEPLIIVPTFMPGPDQAAGVVGVRLTTESGTPQLERVWEFPDFDSAEARQRFRRHPGRIQLAEIAGVETAWVIDTAGSGGTGILTGLRTQDGTPLVDTPLAWAGRRFAQPVVVDDVVYVSSCQTDIGPGTIEAYRIRTVEPE